MNSVEISQEYAPKSSVGEINIVTPDNKTYTEPDSGYYPGTYSFENDANGALPAEWEDNIHTYASVQIIEELGGHKKVLECYSGSQTDSYLHMNNYFEPQTSGIIEWWWRKSSTQNSAAFFMLYNEAGDDMIQIGMDTSNDPNTIFYSGATAEINTGAPYSDDTWIHIRIAFDCAVDRWSLWVDGGLYLDNIIFKLGRTTDTVNRAMFWCYDGGHPTLYYVDAFSYSWDPDYNVGDNLHEGLLLSYDNTTALNWQGYSLDGASNKTILGNTVIPFPVKGNHQIQVFGNDSLGNSYKSQIRYFSIDRTLLYISVLTPLQYSYFNDSAPSFQVTISGENLSSTYYRIGDSKILFFNHQGQIDQHLWNNCAEGLVLITFYVNNTIGNYSAADITIFKDTVLPFVSTYFSYEGTVYHSEAPFFNLNISDANLDMKWYTLNDDPFKHYFTGRYLEIDQGSWDYLDDGAVMITLHATDKAGNENSYQFYVIKDTSTPEPYNPPYFTPYLAIAIGGIVLLGAVVAILVVILNKKPQSRPKRVYYDQNPYQYQTVKPKQPEYFAPKRMLKCPNCSYDEDIDGNFCPQCGARLK